MTWMKSVDYIFYTLFNVRDIVFLFHMLNRLKYMKTNRNIELSRNFFFYLFIFKIWFSIPVPLFWGESFFIVVASACSNRMGVTTYNANINCFLTNILFTSLHFFTGYKLYLKPENIVRIFRDNDLIINVVLINP